MKILHKSKDSIADDNTRCMGGTRDGQEIDIVFVGNMSNLLNDFINRNIR